MALSRYTIVIHPNTLRCIEQALARICTFVVTVDSERAKVYEVLAVHEADLTHEQRELLMTANSVRFIAVAAIPANPMTYRPLRSPAEPAEQRNLQGLRKFLKHGWGARG